MEKLIKFFPLLPEEKDGGRLALALVFYICVPPLVSTIVGFVISLTFILFPVALLIGFAASAYTIVGVVFSILKYLGKDISNNT